MSDIKQLKEESKNLVALVVEDSLTIQKQLKTFLGKLFKEVHTANNGEEALTKFKELSPDVILTDIQMPIMDGCELIENLNKEENKPEIIVFSAYGHSENVMKFLKMGVTGFIQKPVNFEKLTASLLKVVGNINGTDLLKNSEDDFEDKLLKDLNIIKISKAPITIVNHYKGLPLVHEGLITEVTNDYIKIQTQKIQVKAISEERKCSIETQDHIFVSKFVDYNDTTNEVTLENLVKIKRSPRDRENLRIVPNQSFSTTIYTKNEKLFFKPINLSAQSLTLEAEAFDPSKIKVNEEVNIVLGFDISLTSTYNHNSTQKGRVDTKAKVIKIDIKNNSNAYITLTFSLNLVDKKSLEKYIYQREVEIIKEFKYLPSDII